MTPDIKNSSDALTTSQEFAGVCSTPGYSELSVAKLEEMQMEVVRQHRLKKPYFNFTDKGSDLLFRIPLGDQSQDLVVDGGPIGSFTRGEIGVFLQEQARNYVDRDTMGHQFPRGNLLAEQDLLGVFMDGFSEDDLMLVVRKIDDPDKLKIVGGSRIVRGTSSLPVRQTADWVKYKREGLPSSVPTFSALRLSLPAEMANALTASESDCACITRYWKQDDFMRAAMGISYSSLPIDIIALMPLIYAGYYSQSEKGVPSMAIFDIHKRRVAEFVVNNFGAQIIADGNRVHATREVMNSILRYHYGGPRYGGYAGKITVGVFKTEDFLEKALQYLNRANVLTTQRSLQIHQSGVNVQLPSL